MKKFDAPALKKIFVLAMAVFLCAGCNFDSPDGGSIPAVCDADNDGHIDEECVPPGMALIPFGCFNMGDAFGDGEVDESPVHYVCITSDFFLDKHETSNSEYAACVDVGACSAPFVNSSYSRPSYYGNADFDDFPAVYVSWYQAVDFCEWQGKRLPAEAEWEYAARGGLSSKRWPWGDAGSGVDANFWGSGDAWDNDTSPVEYYPPNGFGLYDMAGNVWEWLSDRYDPDYYAISPVDDPLGGDTATNRVARGGGWNADLFNLRISNRQNFDPTNKGSLIGIRCAMDFNM